MCLHPKVPINGSSVSPLFSTFCPVLRSAVEAAAFEDEVRQGTRAPARLLYKGDAEEMEMLLSSWVGEEFWDA